MAENIPTPPEETSAPAERGGNSSPLRDFLETVILAVALFFIINGLTGRFQVIGSSMEPSLHNKQYVIVSKLSYKLGGPQRGDIVVFHPPNGAHGEYIKRIIGLPGERVEVRNGVVWIDDYRLDEPYLTSGTPYNGVWQLGEDEYFVLGDNRANSSDSHSWGLLPRDNIVGRVWLIYWPPQDWGMAPHYRFPEMEQQGE